MAEEWTCGKGLVANAWLPASFGDVSAAMAAMLDIHTTALDLSDEHAVREREAYLSLVEQFRTVATRLQALAAEMAGYRDLPMARHDMAVMTAPTMAETYAKVVHAKEELLANLQGRIEGERQMLAQMRGDHTP
jgi:hypothetical protein